MNQESSPNLPYLYCERSKSFGKPHATDTKWGFTLVFGSTSVENPLRNARESKRVVQQIDCIFFLFRFLNNLLFFFFCYIIYFLYRLFLFFFFRSFFNIFHKNQIELFWRLNEKTSFFVALNGFIAQISSHWRILILTLVLLICYFSFFLISSFIYLHNWNATYIYFFSVDTKLRFVWWFCVDFLFCYSVSIQHFFSFSS